MGRWVALGLVPVAVMLLVVWLGRLQRPGVPGIVAVQTSPGGHDRESAAEKQVTKGSGDPARRKAVDDGGTSPEPKREVGPAIVKGRAPIGGAGPQKRRAHQRIAEAAPVRKIAPAPEVPEIRTSPERPPQKIRVAVNRPSRSEPVLRERLVVLAEGSAFAADFAAPTPAPRRIIAAGGESAPAGQAVIIQSDEKEDRP